MILEAGTGQPEALKLYESRRIRGYRKLWLLPRHPRMSQLRSELVIERAVAPRECAAVMAL